MNRWMKLSLGWMSTLLVVACPVPEVAVDASAADAPTCDCDDGIPCTRDSCDELGACVHVGDCENGWCASLPDGNMRCASQACTMSSECRRDLPCAAPLGCVDGFCRYDWVVDRDGDGERDRGCGGNDCDPGWSSVPAVEVCDGRDNDCDGIVDNPDLLRTDPNNCGACWVQCRSGLCVDGACRCAEGLTMCTECVDTQTHPANCGACGHVCQVGACMGGVCVDEPATHGVDRALRTPELEVSANGDSLFRVVLRPRVLMHFGRPSEAIPEGASTFPLHAVRLDRDGNLVNVTSLPTLSGEDTLAITDEGFYFAGTSVGVFRLFGQEFLPGVVLVGFVPRATGEIAWLHTLSGDLVMTMHAMQSGALALVARGEGAGFRRGEDAVLRMIGADGVVIDLPTPTEVDVYNSVNQLLEGADGGFVAYPSTESDSLPLTGPPSTNMVFAIRHDAAGRRIEALRTGMGRLLCERPDGNAWIVQVNVSVREFTRDAEAEIHRFVPWPGTTIVPVLTAARYEGSGVLLGPGVYRMRDGLVAEIIMTEKLGVSGTFHLGDTSVSSLSPPGLGRRVLPGAQALLTRIDLEPLP